MYISFLLNAVMWLRVSKDDAKRAVQRHAQEFARETADLENHLR